MESFFWAKETETEVKRIATNNKKELRFMINVFFVCKCIENNS